MKLNRRNTRQFEVSLKEKVCKGCKKTFTPRNSLGGKFCSPPCHFAANSAKPRKPIVFIRKNPVKPKAAKPPKETACVICASRFTPTYTGLTKQKTCSSLCHNALAKQKAKPRAQVRMPARTKLPQRKPLKIKRSKTTAIHINACVEYKKRYLEKYNFLSCEVCSVNQAFKFEVHHLYYASKHPHHPNLHNFRNLILICDDCHRKFHGQELKGVFRKLETARGLKELFQKQTQKA